MLLMILAFYKIDKKEAKCFKITFDDDSSIKCSTDHKFDNDGTDVGCFTIFNPTIRQMQLFNSWLFQSLFDEGLTSIWNNLKKMYADPSEYIIGCSRMTKLRNI